ncbi:cation:proton antiporter [Limibacillus halophilus]
MAVADIVLTIAVLLIVIGCVQPLARRSGLPFTVLLAIVGVLIGSLATWLINTTFTNRLDRLAEMVVEIPVSSETFLTVLLPLLLFQGAVTIDVRRLAQDIAPVVLLAVLAVLVTLLFVGGAVYLVAPLPLTVCLLLGAIVATTDPSAVIALFRDLGAPARLTRLVEGESLLNDATAIAIFTALAGVIVTGQQLDLFATSEQLVFGLAGGALLGAVAGQLTANLLAVLRSYRAAQVTIAVALPYVVYIVGNRYFGVSGVVAVVASGLVLSAVGRSRFLPETFQFFQEALEQLSYWATSLVFVLAALLIPKLLADFEAIDLVYILVAICAALAARAFVLFGIFPLLAAARLTQRASAPTMCVIMWGGLRGSVTLALALAVTEASFIEPEIKRFIAIQATGFVLFTLLVQGTTLSTLLRWFGLDQLSAVDRAFRTQVLSQSLGAVRSNVRSFAGRYELEDELVERAIRPYSERLTRVAEDTSFEERVSDRERLAVGLIALANQEKELLMEQRYTGGLPHALVDRYLMAVEGMIDGVRQDGRLGYLRAARRPHRHGRWFRFLSWLHFRLGVQRPLAVLLGQRFQYLLLNRIILRELVVFLEFRLAVLLGERITSVLAEILEQRLTAVERLLEALRLQYPVFAQDLDNQVLERYAFREEIEQINQLREAGIISQDLARNLTAEAYGVHVRIRPRAMVDLKVATPELLSAFPVFKDLEEEELARIARRLKTRVFAGDAFVFRRGDAGDGMYFIASGAVEVRLDGASLRIGRGDFFGEMALIDQAPRSADVRSISYSHLLFLSADAFDMISRDMPALRAKLAAVADSRREYNLAQAKKEEEERAAGQA